MTVWVVLPAYNEAGNLAMVVPQIRDNLVAFDALGHVLVVDDGSTDNTGAVMDQLLLEQPVGLSVLHIRRNAGKSAALRLGFQAAIDGGATTVVMMDADGQDDPNELGRLLVESNAGFGIVTGARVVRSDRLVKRTTSRLYNRVTGMLSGVPGSDFNSGFKVISGSAARDLIPMLYGELHRYITVIAAWMGHTVTEVPVAHHPRLTGDSKYGLSRFWRGFIDLLTVRFLMSYEARPSHLFGALGIWLLGIGFGLLGYLTVLRLQGEAIGGRPLLVVAVLLVVVGLQLLLFGLLAELVVYGRQTSRNPSSGLVGVSVQIREDVQSPSLKTE